jgi:hypothetical protein
MDHGNGVRNQIPQSITHLICACQPDTLTRKRTQNNNFTDEISPTLRSPAIAERSNGLDEDPASAASSFFFWRKLPLPSHVSLASSRSSPGVSGAAARATTELFLEPWGSLASSKAKEREVGYKIRHHNRAG